MSKETVAEERGMFRGEDGRNLIFTFIIVSSLFLLWGTCNGMIDVMDKHFQDELGLTKSQSAWVQFAHYLGYFLMAMPAGWLAGKLGYKGGIIAGLLMVAAGGFWFVPATYINTMAQAGTISMAAAFVGFLIGVCAIAAGLTFLETIANPYTTVLGPQKYAATRINLAQSCNGIGWIFGPIIGGMFFYSKDSAGNNTGSETLYIPYVIVGIVVLLLAVIFYFAYIPDLKAKDEYANSDSGEIREEADGCSIWRHPHFVMAVAAQFLYVAAQAGIFSFFINYMTSEVPAIPKEWGCGFMGHFFHAKANGGLTLSDQGAANLASIGFIFFLTGRFTGAWFMKKFQAHRILGLYGMLNTIACLLIFLKFGWLSVICVFLSYFFMSIMFPTIFALGISGLGAKAKKASAFIVMSIMGGAILPKLMGHVADEYDMSRSFIVPLFCFAFVAVYGYCWPKLKKVEAVK